MAFGSTFCWRGSDHDVRQVVLVFCTGGIWKMKKDAYRDYLKAVAGGRVDADLDEFGTYIGEPENVTDITVEQARAMLARNFTRNEV